VPAADTKPAVWRFTTSKPATNWFAPAFDASAWSEGPAGFGTRETPGAIIGTTWKGNDIWLRRVVELPQGDLSNLQAWLYHDEDAEIYVNGVLALRARGYVTSYDAVSFNGRGSAAFKPGQNIVAIHCHQTGGGQYIDLGLVMPDKD
jgi:hypothetical protein